MTQVVVAEKMHTSQLYVAKGEGGQVSPSMKALQRCAAATGSRLRIEDVGLLSREKLLAGDLPAGLVDEET